MSQNETRSWSRREFLKLGLGAAAGSLLPMPAMAAVLKNLDPQRKLTFYNIHTNESLSICYYDEGIYRPQSLERIDHILRDYRTGGVVPIDPKLLDVLFALKCRMRSSAPFSVISGYRSPATNAMLRHTTSGVARCSFHTKGRAIDIRLPGYNTKHLRDLCIKLKAGGVGYYPKHDFVHLDTGRVRTW